MEIEEADRVTVASNVVETRVIVESAERGHGETGTICTGHDLGGATSRGTQTAGHVFLGRQGEVIIATNYVQVQLVINEEAVKRLTGSAEVDLRRSFADLLTTPLARLDWNGERILEKAMTAFCFTFKEELMPQLVEELVDVLKTEADHHRAQRLARHLLETHAARLFGIDVRSVSFILEHCSVDDARETLRSAERAEELKQVFLSFLPDWAAWEVFVVHCTDYTLTPDDRSQDFGFETLTKVSFAASSRQMERPDDGNPAGDVSPSPVMMRRAPEGDPEGTVAQQARLKQKLRGSSRYSIQWEMDPETAVEQVHREKKPRYFSGVMCRETALSGMYENIEAEDQRGIYQNLEQSEKPRRGWADTVVGERQDKKMAKHTKSRIRCCVM